MLPSALTELVDVDERGHVEVVPLEALEDAAERPRAGTVLHDVHVHHQCPPNGGRGEVSIWSIVIQYSTMYTYITSVHLTGGGERLVYGL